MVAAAPTPTSAQVQDLTQRRLQRALRQRVRYRYVQPKVLVEDGCYRVQSPCCSRRVDPTGGMIDIALLVPHPGNRWCLCSRDHAQHSWVARCQDQPLSTVLDLLCVDADRQFWP